MGAIGDRSLLVSLPQKRHSTMVEEVEASPAVAPVVVPLPSGAASTSASVAARSCKAPDSACSVGNSHSQSQRSGSSKSRISSSTGSGSSGYGGHPSTLSNGTDAFPLPRAKDKEEHRKKQLKLQDEPADQVGATPNVPLQKGDTAPAKQAAVAPAVASNRDLPQEEAATEAKAPGAAAASAPTSGHGVGVAPPHRPSLGTFLQASKAGAAGAETASPDRRRESDGGLDGCRRHQLRQRAPARPELQQPAPDDKDEFTVVVSMQDGAIIYTSPSITQTLAFPRDMLVGKSFIDYVHPDDRLALIRHITAGVAQPRRPSTAGGASGEAAATTQAPLFCRLRRYPSLRDGFAVAERRLVHRPFLLQLSFYELPAKGAASGAAPAALPPGVLLTVTATAICSAFTSADETPAGGCRFATRHRADGQLTHVDSEAVPLLGFLPQQLEGRPIFDAYHPADLRALQRVYRQLVSSDCEAPLRGAPHRLRAHNGCYVRVHTEWSSFVNPWTRRLEFVVGQHRVLQGPSCPDVFAEPQDEEMFSEELLHDSRAAQEEICLLLQQEVRRGEPASDRRDVSRRCKDLASFMEAIIGEIGTKAELRVDPAADQMKASFSERSSVTLGEISPHHDCYDSKSSSETPPSYNQLNYDDNIQRFFESKPKTTPSEDSGERMMALEMNGSVTDVDTKAVTAASDCCAARKCLSPVNDTGSGSNFGSGSGSAGVSGNNASVDTADADGDYKSPQLTEARLSRHNEDMEKRMVQRHREQRSKGGGGGDGKCKKQHHGQAPPDTAQHQVEGASSPSQAAAHGTKRSGSHSWDGEPLKASKHSHAPSPPAAPPAPTPPRVEALPPATAPGPPPTSTPATAEDAGLSLWPPFSVALTSLQPPQACAARGNSCAGGCCGSGRGPQILPLYYLPAPAHAPAPTTAGGHPQQQSLGPAFLQQQGGCAGGALPYVAAGVLYQAAPVLYPLAPPPPPPSHLLALHHHQQHHSQNHNHPSNYQLAAAARAPVSLPASALPRSQPQLQTGHRPLPPLLPRPASCATSVKVEPGSSAASVAASVLNRGASEGSQKCCRTSGEEETEAEDSSGSGLRGQSSSSYTYSFLRSDGDSCRGADGAATGAEDMLWERMENGSFEGTSKRRPVLKDPPWLENVEVTPDLMFRYQVSKRDLAAVLKDDLKKLRAVTQPVLVNEQLGQLYLDMARDGPAGDDLRLDEGEFTSSSAGSGNDSAGPDTAATHASHKTRRKRRSLDYSRLVMIFEENAPMPSPVLQPA